MSEAADTSAPTTAVSGYDYKSHFDDPKDKEVPAKQSPIACGDALAFCCTMKRVRRDTEGAEAKAFWTAHPAVARYEGEIRKRLLSEDAARNSNQPFGVIRHLHKIMRWPYDQKEWDEARENHKAYPRSTGPDQKARSNMERGMRADDEIQLVLSDEKVTVRELSMYGKWAIMYFYQRQWLPLDSQLPIWSTDGALIRTWADVLCYDMTRPGHFILVEMKTGYCFGYDDELTKFSQPFQHTPANEHQMQLGWMEWRLASYLRSIGTLSGYVLRIHSKHNHCIPAPRLLLPAVKRYFLDHYAAAEIFEDVEEVESVVPLESIPKLLSSKKKRAKADGAAASVRGKKRRAVVV